MSQSLIKQLGRPDSKARAQVELILEECCQAPMQDLTPSERWDTCKCALIEYFRQCDKRNAQRVRDKRNRAAKLAKWGDEQDLPRGNRFKDASAVRQELRSQDSQGNGSPRLQQRANQV